MRSGAGSWPRESRSRVVKRGRIPLPWARSGYDWSMGRWRVRYRPGRKGPVTVPGIVLFWGAAIPGDMVQPGTCTRYEAGDCLLGGSVPHDYGVRRIEAVSTRVPSRVLPKSAGRCIAGMMESHDCGASQSQGPRPGVPATGDGWLEPDPHPPQRLSDRANSKNGRPYGPLWAFRRMSGSDPTLRKSGSGPSRLGAVRKRSVK